MLKLKEIVILFVVFILGTLFGRKFFARATNTFMDLKEFVSAKGMYVGDLPAKNDGSCSDVYSKSKGAICNSSQFVVDKMKSA